MRHRFGGIQGQTRSEFGLRNIRNAPAVHFVNFWFDERPRLGRAVCRQHDLLFHDESIGSFVPIPWPPDYSQIHISCLAFHT